MYLVLLLFVSLYTTLVQPAPHYDLEKASEYFENFTITYNKIYKSEHEKEYRFNIFKENLKEIIRFNDENDGEGAYGINQFADLTPNEFLNKRTGHCRGIYGYRRINNEDDKDNLCTRKTDKDVPNIDTPESYDWRENNVATPVKDQGNCGSCWAFASSAYLESQYALKYNKTVSLSEQQIIDCDRISDGCCGGLATRAFSAIKKVGGLLQENHYTLYEPHHAVKNSCRKDLNNNIIKVTDCFYYKISSQEKVKQLLYTNGPIVIGIKGTALQYFPSGQIVTDKQCNIGEINHAVLLVGYGIDNDKPYWIVKNSWGTMFDENGFFRMERSENPEGACGMLTDFLVTATID